MCFNEPLIEPVLLLIIGLTIIKLFESSFQQRERPLAIPSLILALFLWIGFVLSFIGFLPNIAISQEEFKDTFGAIYVLFVKVIVFLTAIYGISKSFRFGPTWAAWLFFLVVVTFNPWWNRNSYDGIECYSLIIKYGTTLWLSLAGFIVYPKTNERKEVWNKYPLVIPAVISTALLLLDFLKYLNLCTQDTSSLFLCYYGFSLFVETVLFSVALYGTVLSFIFGRKWFAVVFCFMSILLAPISHHDLSFYEELFAVLWLCFAGFLLKKESKL